MSFQICLSRFLLLHPLFLWIEESQGERECVRGREDDNERGERKNYLKDEIESYSNGVNIHDCCSNFVYTQSYRPTDVVVFKQKCVKFVIFSILSLLLLAFNPHNAREFFILFICYVLSLNSLQSNLYFTFKFCFLFFFWLLFIFKCFPNKKQKKENNNKFDLIKCMIQCVESKKRNHFTSLVNFKYLLNLHGFNIEI